MEFFVVTIIDIHQLNLGPFGNLIFWLKIHSTYVFFSFFLVIKTKYYMYLKKKPIPNERKRDFVVRHCNIFQISFV
jgi:hypothetical protein